MGQEDKKGCLNTGITTLLIIYCGWTHSLFLKCEWYYVQLYLQWYRALAPKSVQDFCFTLAMGRVVSQVRPRMNWTKQSNWTKFPSLNYWGQMKNYFQRRIPGPWLALPEHRFGSITLLSCLNRFPCSYSPEFQPLFSWVSTPYRCWWRSFIEMFRLCHQSPGRSVFNFHPPHSCEVQLCCCKATMESRHQGLF